MRGRVLFFPTRTGRGVNKLFSFGGFKSFQETVEILRPPAVVHTHIGRNIARGSGVLESDSRSPRLCCCCCACCRQAGGTLTKNIYSTRETNRIDWWLLQPYFLDARAQTVMLCQYYKLFVVRVFPADDEFDAAPPELAPHAHKIEQRVFLPWKYRRHRCCLQ